MKPEALLNDSLREAAEDHALSRVPAAERKSGYSLSISTVGIVTTLVLVAIGGFSISLAGFRLGLLAGCLVALLAFLISRYLGRIAYYTGMSSTVTSRFYGLGYRGSSLASLIFAFMILGMLALESALLYEGTLFMFALDDTWPTRIAIYSGLTITWILLAIFGLKVVLRSSAILILATFLILAYLVYLLFFELQGALPFHEILAYAGTIPGSSWDRFEAAFTLSGGTAGTIALVTCDYARYCRSQRDVTILSAAGPLFQNVVVLLLGAFIVLGSLPIVSAYLAGQGSSSGALGQALHMALENTGAYFVLLAGWTGFVAMYVTQVKAQALNAYSGSLSLVNLFDSLLSIKPGRAVMVVVGNLIGLAMIAGGILEYFSQLIPDFGSATLALCGVMISDFYFVRRPRSVSSRRQIEQWNWAGIITLVLSAAIGLFLNHSGLFSMGFLVTLLLALFAYPPIRALLPEGFGTSYVGQDIAEKEAA